MQHCAFFYLKDYLENDDLGSWKEKGCSVDVRPGLEEEFWAGKICFQVAKIRNDSKTAKTNMFLSSKIWKQTLHVWFIS